MTYWAVCYTEPRCEIKGRDGVQGLERGAFLPTFVTTYMHRGRLRTTEQPILKSYLLVALNGIDDEAWSAIGHLDGIQRVITNNCKPAKVSDHEVSRLMLDHVTGANDRIQYRSSSTGRFERKKRRRRCRPRAGKKASSSTYIKGEANNGIRHAS